MNKLTISIGSDHRGFRLKADIISRLSDMGHKCVDCGSHGENSCDAGDFAQKVVANIKEYPEHIGILICGSGQAMAMTANRYRHIRAALCVNSTMAKMARQHNDANVLVLGAHMIGQEVAMDCIDAFLNTEFLGGRYAQRCAKLEEIGGL